jgi:hypothetical protein
VERRNRRGGRSAQAPRVALRWCSRGRRTVRRLTRTILQTSDMFSKPAMPRGLSLCESHDGVDLLLSDIVMPGWADVNRGMRRRPRPGRKLPMSITLDVILKAGIQRGRSCKNLGPLIWLTKCGSSIRA